MSATAPSHRPRRHSTPPLQSAEAATGPSKSRIQVWVWGVVLVGIAVIAVGFVWNPFATSRDPLQATLAARSVVPAEYDPVRAFGFLEQTCAIGPRVSGTAGMVRQQEMLTKFFEAEGAEVELQTFAARHPETGEVLTLGNLIARFRPAAAKRFLICAHYDTRPFPDQDPIDPKGEFIGANDGASGVAGLMELSLRASEWPADIGVDLVLFDGEELVYDGNRDPYFLGSTHFAQEYVAAKDAPRYQSGVLLDMIADAEQHLFIEQNSWRYARPVVRQVWGTAARLRVQTFKNRIVHEVRDDHLPLNTIAKIPTIDIIDFDYPRPTRSGPSYWHTRQDVPANCSGQSIVNVVYVVDQWLKSM